MGAASEDEREERPMSRSKRIESLATVLAFAIAASGASAAYLFAPIAGKLILGALFFFILLRVVKDRRLPDFGHSGPKSRKRRKGGKRQWFHY